MALDVDYMRDNFFLKEIVYEDKFSFRNGDSYFTIIAPTFGNLNDMTAYTIPFMAYLSTLSEITKERSGRDSAPIVLDLIKPYGKINGWPEEKLNEEKRVKLGIVKEISKKLNLGIEILELEKIEDINKWKDIEEFVRSVIRLPITEDVLRSCKECSYDRFADSETLMQRIVEYNVKRWTEYTYMTQSMNALTIKCSRPEIDKIYDVVCGYGDLCGGTPRPPRFYIPKMLKSRIFRPTPGEITIGMPEDEIRKITDNFNPEKLQTLYLSTIGCLISSPDDRIKEAVEYRNAKTKSDKEIKDKALAALDFILSLKVNAD